MYRAIVIRSMNHYWFALQPLLVCTPTTTGLHSEVVVVRTPLLYYPYALRFERK